MPRFIPHHTVVIHRDGKNIRPPIGKPFDFTEEEAAELLSLHPTCLRRPLNEGRAATEVTSEEDDENDGDDTGETTRTAGRKTAAPRKSAGRKTSATAEDDEL